MEMALTQCKWADFVVFTQTEREPSIFVKRISFSAEMWDAMRSVIVSFYTRFVALKLLTRRVKCQVKLVQLGQQTQHTSDLYLCLPHGTSI